MVGRQLLNAARWFMLVRVHRINLRYVGAAKLTLAGSFASNFLPTTVGGDVLRLVGVMDASEDRVVGTTTVFLDRVISLVGMIVFLPFGVPILQGIVGEGLVLGGPASIAADGLWRFLRRGWQRLTEAARLWRQRPLAIITALLVNWLAVGSYLLAVWTVARHIGIPITYWQVAGATSLTYFLTLLPISINGYGLRELGVVAVYTQLGAAPEEATALAFITRGLMWATSLPGMIWLGELVQSAGRQLSEVRSEEMGL